MLTCAKTNVEQNGENALPGEEMPVAATETVSQTSVEVSQEEKDNVKKLMASLGL